MLVGNRPYSNWIHLYIYQLIWALILSLDTQLQVVSRHSFKSNFVLGGGSHSYIFDHLIFFCCLWRKMSFADTADILESLSSSSSFISIPPPPRPLRWSDRGDRRLFIPRSPKPPSEGVWLRSRLFRLPPPWWELDSMGSSGPPPGMTNTWDKCV